MTKILYKNKTVSFSKNGSATLTWKPWAKFGGQMLWIHYKELSMTELGINFKYSNPEAHVKYVYVSENTIFLFFTDITEFYI